MGITTAGQLLLFGFSDRGGRFELTLQTEAWSNAGDLSGTGLTATEGLRAMLKEVCQSDGICV